MRFIYLYMLCFILIFFSESCSKRPSYHGKSLEHWYNALKEKDTGNSRKAIRVLIEIFKDPCLGKQAAMVLARDGPRDEDTIEALHMAMQCNDKNVRANALSAISEMRLGKASISILREGISDNDYVVRLIAAEELGKTEDREAVPALIYLLKDKEACVRIEAINALGSLGREASSAARALMDIINFQFDDELKYAIIALGKIRPDPKEAESALNKLLKNKDQDIRKAAKDALQQIQAQKRAQSRAGVWTRKGDCAKKSGKGGRDKPLKPFRETLRVSSPPRRA